MISIDHLLPESEKIEAGKLNSHPRLGIYLDIPEQPEWARRIARWAKDEARANVRCTWRTEDAIPGKLQGVGKGKRALLFALAMRISPTLFKGAQQFNNCAAWCKRANAGCAMAYDIAAKGDLQEYPADPGTAVCWSFRGSRYDTGMTLDQCVWVAHNCGIQLRTSYLGGKYDLTKQADDENSGYKWGGFGAPKDLLEAIAANRIEQVGEVSEEQAVQDALYLGGSIMTGSSYTARDGDPISPLTTIGGHAQALIGYDDTDEFRAWYKQVTGKTLTDWVGVFDQSWYPNWITVEDWPEHLWGPRPEGAFVLTGQDTMKLIRQSAKYSADSGSARVFRGTLGFEPKTLPDWGSQFYL